MDVLELRYLTLSDVLATGLQMAEVIHMAEETLGEHGGGRFENPPKPGIHPLENAFIHAMPAYLPQKHSCGIKWVSGFPDNYRYSVPSIMGLIVLNDVKTGQPLAIMDGSYITAMRTAAVSAVSAKYLARQNAETVGIVGAGAQARYHVLSFKEVLPSLKTIRLFDTMPAAIDGFKKVLEESLPPELVVCQSMQAVFEGADIVVTATGHLNQRIFREAWIQNGMLVLPVHTRGWEHEAITKTDKFIVDDWQQFSSVMGGDSGYYAPLPAAPYAQLGQIVVGSKPGREKDEERIINFNFGMAIHDIHVAATVLQKAEKSNLGRMLPFIDRQLPLL